MPGLDDLLDTIASANAEQLVVLEALERSLRHARPKVLEAIRQRREILESS